MAEPKTTVNVAAPQPPTSPSPTAPLTRIDRDYDAIAERAEASCTPPDDEDDGHWRIKEADINSCLEEAADSELKAAISTGTRGAAKLAGFARALSTYEGALAELIETTDWIDPSTRIKYSGSAYDSALLGCWRDAVKERIRHWHARQLGDTAALARRIGASRQAGEETAAKLREWTRDAEAALANRPTDWELEEMARSGTHIVGDEEWQTIATEARRLESAAADLASQTCAAVAELAAALGGEPPCVLQTTHYYLGVCTFH